MKVKVWTLTTDGVDNPVCTEVFGSEEAAKASLIEGLESYGLRRCKDGHKLSAGSLSELSELWEEAAEGFCHLEEHEVEVGVIGAS